MNAATRKPVFLTLMLLVPLLAALPAMAGDMSPEQQAWQAIDDGALVIDVRSPEEFERGHLPDAVRISHTETEALAEAIGTDMSREVVLYCGSGRRSGRAIAELEALGYTGLVNGMGYQGLMEAQPRSD